MAQPVSDSSFETEVLKAEQPVLIDFWAEWCGPCKMLSPLIDQVSEEMRDKVKVVKMNIDENPHTPGKLGVRGIPTLMLFKDGQLSATKVGAMPKQQLSEWLNSVL